MHQLSKAVVLTLVAAALAGTCSNTIPTCPGRSESDSLPCHDGSAPRGDFLMLSVSWAPNFCCGAGRNQASKCGECSKDSQIADPFFLHGLWPQCANGSDHGPYLGCCCTGNTPSEEELMRECAIVESHGRNGTAGWCQSIGVHEFVKHGTCSGHNARGYYQQVDAVYNDLRLNHLESIETYVENQRQEGEAKVTIPGRVLEQYLPANSVLRASANEIHICVRSTASNGNIMHFGFGCPEGVAQTNLPDIDFVTPGYCTSQVCDRGAGPGGDDDDDDDATDKCVRGRRGPKCENHNDCCKYSKCLRCAGSGYCTAEPGTDYCSHTHDAGTL